MTPNPPSDRAPARTSVAALIARLPGPPTDRHPGGAPFVRGLAHGTMTVELFVPAGEDRQLPHDQDELYFVLAGSATLRIAGEPHPCGPGDAFFVPAGVEHRFEDLTPGFATWVVFWGPEGGE